MGRDIISLSHNDADGSGAQMCVNHVYKHTHNITFLNASYTNMVEKLIEVDDLIKKTLAEKVYITDLSMKGNDVELLISIINDHPKTEFILIDHHPVFEDSFDIINGFDNATYIHDGLTHNTLASGSLLTYWYLGIEEPSLFRIITLIDVYDVWREDHRLFPAAVLFNDYFWSVKQNSFFYEFRNNYHIKDRVKRSMKENQKAKDAHFDGLERNNLIADIRGNYGGKIKLFFTSEYIGDCQLRYPESDVYIIVHWYGKYRINIGSHVPGPIADEIKEGVLNNLPEEPISAGGHQRCFSINTKKEGADIILPYAKHLVEVVSDII